MDKKTIQQVVARNVHAMRESLGWSSAQLAQKAGVAKATLSQVERSLANPTLETLWALARALRVNFADLLQDSGSGTSFSVLREEALTTALLTKVDGRSVTEVYRLDLEQGRSRIAQSHPSGVFEVVVVVEGRAQVGPLAHARVLERGECLRFPADVSHVYAAQAEGCTLLVCVCYPPDSAECNRQTSWDADWRKAQGTAGVFRGSLPKVRAAEVWEANAQSPLVRTYLLDGGRENEVEYAVLPECTPLPEEYRWAWEREKESWKGEGLVLEGQDAEESLRHLKGNGKKDWVLIKQSPITPTFLAACRKVLRAGGVLGVCVSLMSPYRGSASYSRQAELVRGANILSAWPEGVIVPQTSAVRETLEQFSAAWEWGGARETAGDFIPGAFLPDGPQIAEMAASGGFRMRRHYRLSGNCSSSEWAAGLHGFVLAPLMDRPFQRPK